MARHWRDAGRPERAVGYFLTAAEQAGRGWAKDRAALFYGEALACLPEDDEQRLMIRRRQAVAAAAAVHIRDARDLIRLADGVRSEREKRGPEPAGLRRSAEREVSGCHVASDLVDTVDAMLAQ